MSIDIFQVDAFAESPFSGNPAAVVLLQESMPDQWMRDVAMEMNLSETAFLLPSAAGYKLRWFTPLVEVDLCGHATLASAHVLWQAGHLPPSAEARFHTRSGLLRASRAGAWIELDFPVEPADPVVSPPEALSGLGAEAYYVGINRMDYLVQVENEAVLRALEPDLARLAELPMRGVIVTSRSHSDEFDFVSRFFAPAAGINEDPVTGSAHCCLAPFWAERLGKTEMVGYQASARGGIVRVRLGGDRVYLQGKAVTVLRGQLYA